MISHQLTQLPQSESLHWTPDMHTQHTPLIFIWSSNPLETHSHTHTPTHSHTRSFISFYCELANGDQQRGQLVCVCVCEKHKYFSLTFRIELTNCQHACCLATGVANIFQLNVCGEIKLQNLTIYWQTHKFDLVLGLHLLELCEIRLQLHTHSHTHTYTYM